MAQSDDIEQVATKALEACRVGGELPAEIISAVADGSGSRERVRQLETEALSEPLELAIFDADRIGEWVFESSRPPVIAGASHILERLNLEIRRRFRESVVFSGGGEGLLLLGAGQADQVCKTIQKMFRNCASGALSATTYWKKVWPSDFLPAESSSEGTFPGLRLVTGTAALLAELRDEIRRKKHQRSSPRRAVSGSKERCAACRDRAGEPTLPIADYRPGDSDEEAEPGILCAPCNTRWKEGRKKIAGTSLQEVVQAYSQNSDPGHEVKTRYVGFLYCDGNSMGTLFCEVKSLRDLHSLSQAVTKVFQHLDQRAREHIQSRARARHSKPDTDRFLSFLGGGDEVIWILPARLAVEVAERLPEWVRQESNSDPTLAKALKAVERRELSVGTGLVICDCKYPVRYQHEMARALQKSAKELFYGSEGASGSVIDFEVITDATPRTERLSASRRLAYSSEETGFALTCRPYRDEDFSKLVDRVRKAAAAGFPSSQLYALARSAAEGERIFLNFLLYQMARNSDAYRGWLGLDLWNPEEIEACFLRDQPGASQAGRSTWVADAVELRPFL